MMIRAGQEKLKYCGSFLNSIFTMNCHVLVLTKSRKTGIVSTRMDKNDIEEIQHKEEILYGTK